MKIWLQNWEELNLNFHTRSTDFKNLLQLAINNCLIQEIKINNLMIRHRSNDFQRFQNILSDLKFQKLLKNFKDIKRFQHGKPY